MTSAREAWALCIDFGTAFSKAAAAPAGAWSRFHPEDVRPLMLSREEGANPFLLDSAVFVDEDRILFGRAALARADALAHKKRQALRSFKTLLSVSDLDRALNTGAPASIDPHRIFPMRDLVVLYLAYLLAATDRAVRAKARKSSSSACSRVFLLSASRARSHSSSASASAPSASVHAASASALTSRPAERFEVGRLDGGMCRSKLTASA
jgi:hypothetical protein